MLDRTSDPVARAEAASAVLRRWASEVDRENRFPRESIEALRAAGLLALMVPVEFGGEGGGFRLLARVASVLGEGCLSTAIIWAMHAQQVLTLADHRCDARAEALTAVVQDSALIASVTSEPEGGALLAPRAPLLRAGDRLRLKRSAPFVSYAAAARFFLVTMAAEEGSPGEARLVLVGRDDAVIRPEGEWHALGMRGTQSIPLSLEAVVEPDQVFAEPLRAIAVRTLIPAGHVGWSAAWYGAARGALRQFVRRLRRKGSERSARLDSDLLLSRLAELRAQLDPIGALLERVADRLDKFRDQGAPAALHEQPTHQIELNNLKIVASEAAYRVVDQLVELAGLRDGYLDGDELGLERVFRDLRSASLMYGNERLRQANGRLILFEDTAISSIWRQ